MGPVSQLASGDTKVEFEYDYMNRRVSKKVTSWDPSANGGAGGWAATPSLHRRFVYHNWLLLLELDARDDNAVERKYTWGLDIAAQRASGPSRDREGAGSSIDAAGGIGGLLACLDTQGTPSTGENPEADDDSFAFFYDANGNVGQLVDLSDGSLDARYEYGAYGNVTFSDGAYAAENKIRFSTKYWDDETGLGYWGFRYYDPRTGRWTSRDPIGETGGRDLYAFVSQQPTCLYDPRGLTDLYGGVYRPTDVDDCRRCHGSPAACRHGAPIPHPCEARPTTPQPLSGGVSVCCRNTEFGDGMGHAGDVIDCCTWAVGAKHCWLKTTSKEAGLGPAGGRPPEDESCPCCTQASINDHTGQCKRDNVACFALPGCDEECVNRELQVGRSEGRFWPFSNDCNVLVRDILQKCKCNNDCLQWKPHWEHVDSPMGGPGGRTFRVGEECAKRKWNDVPRDYPVPGEGLRF